MLKSVPHLGFVHIARDALMTMHLKTNCQLRLLILTVAALAAHGCQQTSRDLSLDIEQARTACTTFLDAWKAGKQPDDLRPDITGTISSGLPGTARVLRGRARRSSTTARTCISTFN